MTSAYIIIIVFMVFGKYLLDLSADILNLKALNRDLPEEFADLYDADEYRKSQEYTATNTQFKIIYFSFKLAVLLVFWFLGGFAALDLYVKSLNFPFLITGLLYIGALALANNIMSIPFAAYQTFVIEERFGFNLTKRKTFVSDRVKILVLSILIGGVILAPILYLFQNGGAAEWIYAWVAVVLITAFIKFIMPRVIIPLFLKFTPLEEGELKNRTLELAQKLEFPVSGIFVVDGSKRSTKQNAFFSGFGKYKRIALFDTLIANNTVSEIVAVLGHEIGHYKKKHEFIMLTNAIIKFGVMFFLLSFFLEQKELFNAFGVHEPSVYTGLVFFLILFSFVGQLWSVAENLLSRKNEYDADEYSAKNCEGSEAMISWLKKAARAYLDNITPHPFYVFLNYSHPPLKNRVAALKKIT